VIYVHYVVAGTDAISRPFRDPNKAARWIREVETDPLLDMNGNWTADTADEETAVCNAYNALIKTEE
jgi:hypothetical protein